MSAQHLRLSALIGALLCTNIANATVFKSTGQQTGLLELYTSEGCSSCPPADNWMSSLKEKAGLWRDFIPLAFHVDYWDYIGWRDRFANPAHSERQRQYAHEQQMRTIYTPGFMYNGQEWRQWFARRYFNFPEAGMAGKLVADIVDQQASVRFTPLAGGGEKLDVNIVLLGFDLETPIKAGENRGKTLKHDFVVLGSRRERLTPDTSQYVATIELPEKSAVAPRYAVAVWVSPRDNQRPLQAVGGWLE